MHIQNFELSIFQEVIHFKMNFKKLLIIFTFMMLSVIIRFLSYGLIQCIICFYPYTTLIQPNRRDTYSIAKKENNKISNFSTRHKW